ncbi:MAG: histidine phosphatase family protein [Rhodanobacter sp.]
MKQVVLVRHGPTECTLQGRICGRHDPALTADGIQAASFAALHPAVQGADIVVSSPMLRAYQTALAIAEMQARTPVVDDRLHEIDFGAWDGMSKGELAAESAYAAWERDPDVIAPPDGETALAAQARVIQAFTVHMAHAEKVVFVSHKGVLRLLISHLLGQPAKRFRAVADLPTASITQIKIASCGVSLVLVGDTSHITAKLDLGVY